MLLWVKRLIYCNVVRRSHGEVGQQLALGPLIQPIIIELSRLEETFQILESNQ